MALHKFFGEALARLQLRGGLRGAEDAPAAPGKFVHDSKRRGNSGPMTVRSGWICSATATSESTFFTSAARHTASSRDPAIAGRAINLGNPRRLAQLPYQGMLAPAASNDQNFHSRRLTRLGGRAGDVKRGHLHGLMHSRFRSCGSVRRHCSTGWALASHHLLTMLNV